MQEKIEIGVLHVMTKYIEQANIMVNKYEYDGSKLWATHGRWSLWEMWSTMHKKNIVMKRVENDV